MTRAVLCVLDSFGIGGAPDAEAFGDQGSDTLGHIAAACAQGNGDRDGLRNGPLELPNLVRLGLANAAQLSSGNAPSGLAPVTAVEGGWGCAAEMSRGKDTPSGHWEIAGVPVTFEWGYFPDTVPCFPPELTDALIKRCELGGILGNEHASGTEIIARLGEEHIRTGYPICYTSADSVFQIAAHEDHFGLDRLYDLCESAFELVAPWRIGRVIARPFTGTSPADFARTGNRRDFSVPPPAPTLLDTASGAGREVIAVGKISDIFARQGITRPVKATGNNALMEATMTAMGDAPDGALVFTNFVDFDMLYGHRRDVPGYAAALEAFDAQIPALERALKPGDMAVFTADHGCDPTWHGTDHTREQVPVLAFGPAAGRDPIGRRETFADIGQSLADHLDLPPLDAGTSWIR